MRPCPGTITGFSAFNKRSGQLANKLSALGFLFPDSETNFLFVTHPKKKAEDLFRELRQERILVRYFNKPRIDNYLRVTIGTDEEMDKLVGVLKEFL